MASEINLCALTGKDGKFVDCHIIPKSLTYCSNKVRRGKSEAQFIEISTFGRPKRAQSSWFDKKLVVQCGEDLLSHIDTHGLQLLEKYSLVGIKKPVLSTAIRSLQMLDNEVQILRRFLLSILWRAAVTSRPEFSEVNIDELAREKLRLHILGEQPLDIADFPISACELIGDLPDFNTVPYVESREIVNQTTRQTISSDDVVFYLSGLVVTFGCKTNDVPRYKALKAQALGYSDSWEVGQVRSLEIVGSLREQVEKTRKNWRLEFSRLAN